ncbi:iron-sulfur cluster biosynthesis family protein [Microbacterium sp. NPDC058021]|uniref:iron-sulfur cluster biosynthesis family protein n=1 Tax=unclassified Microbacterium TaxID=2609290 RepID=UPI00214CA4B9|nr:MULTISPECIES: iron-sulfur cluster biosynthesis family protein [unclassified Microbacterium]MCR2799494.1 Fe-S cluster assembly protein HesB [Microbacterium sp. zg.Y818]WIM21491.1 iron-sulfur cluster biosynthesis family protein [Microbacterium sp. zg-Y818]
MLTLTENATSAVKTLTSQIPTEEGGLRIRGADQAEAGFELALVSSPEPEDAVIETDGARVFVEQAAALPLDDRVLDAQIGDDGSLSFALGVRA